MFTVAYQKPNSVVLSPVLYAVTKCVVWGQLDGQLKQLTCRRARVVASSQPLLDRVPLKPASVYEALHELFEHHQSVPTPCTNDSRISRCGGL